MGASKMHSSTVGLVRNLQTGSITPQFHLVFDDFFETVNSTEEEEPKEWEDLVVFNQYKNDLDDDDGSLELTDEWLSPEELFERKQQRMEERDDAIDFNRKQAENQREPKQKEEKEERKGPQNQSPPNLKGRQREVNREPQVHPAPEANVPEPRQPEPEGLRRSARPNKGKKPERFGEYAIRMAIAKRHAETTISSIFKIKRPLVVDYRYAIALLTDRYYGTLEDMPVNSSMVPIAFKMKAQSDPDMPRYHEAMAGPQREEYQKAMDEEMGQLDKLNAWTIMRKQDVPEGANVLPLTWVLRVKRYPDGRFRKFKARLCVRGDKQVEGVDYFEKYAPVVQWSTVRMMLCLSATQGLKSRQVDFTNAFVQADLKEDIYVKCPEGYGAENGEEVVMKLNKSLYGLVQAPMHWGMHLRKGLEKRGFTVSPHDPCMFINKQGMVILAYVDDCLMFAKTNREIDDLIKSMKVDFPLTVEAGEEDNVYAYLGVDLTKNSDGTMTFTQTGLTEKILKTTGMEESSPKSTPSGTQPLGTDANGRPCECAWNYASVVGMLLYLSSNSRPDIQFAVHQCARFTHDPKASHEEAIKRICRYLKGTKTQGMTFKPDSTMQLNCYVDADFAGLWNVEDDQDPVCVKSRTGYVLTLGNCPLLWVSKLQTEIALSTTEAEYIALSQAMRDLIPMRSLLQEIGTKLNLEFAKPALVHSKVFEDNNGALTLANAPKMNPRTKHIAIKYHHFREKVGTEKGIEIVKIDTKEQIADGLTKGLAREQYEYLRKKMIGW
jgi:hypothetical protein